MQMNFLSVLFHNPLTGAVLKSTVGTETNASDAENIVFSVPRASLLSTAAEPCHGQPPNTGASALARTASYLMHPCVFVF